MKPPPPSLPTRQRTHPPPVRSLLRVAEPRGWPFIAAARHTALLTPDGWPRTSRTDPNPTARHIYAYSVVVVVVVAQSLFIIIIYLPAFPNRSWKSIQYGHARAPRRAVAAYFRRGPVIHCETPFATTRRKKHRISDELTRSYDILFRSGITKPCAGRLKSRFLNLRV